MALFDANLWVLDVLKAKLRASTGLMGAEMKCVQPWVRPAGGIMSSGLEMPQEELECLWGETSGCLPICRFRNPTRDKWLKTDGWAALFQPTIINASKFSVSRVILVPDVRNETHPSCFFFTEGLSRAAMP